MDFVKSVLFDRWLADQVLALNASELARSNDLGCEISVRAAKLILSAHDNLCVLSDATLHCIASIPRDNQVAWVKTEEIVVAAVIDSAKTLLDELTITKPDSVSEKCNHQALLNHSVTLLKQPEFRFEEFISWVRRASPDGQLQLNQPFWTRGGWDLLAKSVKNSDLLVRINLHFATFRDPQRECYDRIAAICEIYKVVVDAVERAGQKTPNAWLRLCMALVSSLFCTPIMVTTTGGIKTGTSLPVLVSLTDPERKKKWQSGYVFFHGGTGNRYVPPDSPNKFRPPDIG